MADEETVIDKRYEIDTYVKGIGMVKKSMINTIQMVPNQHLRGK